MAAVLVWHRSSVASLSLLSSLEFSLVESIVEFDRELDHSVELLRSVNPHEFVLDILLESSLKEPDVGIVIEVEMRDDLLEFGGVHAGRPSLSQSIESSFRGSCGINVPEGLFKFLLKHPVGRKDLLSDISPVLLRFVIEFPNVWFKPFKCLSA